MPLNNIVILYSEAMGYTMACLNEVSKYNSNYVIHLISWDKKKLTPYKVYNDGNIKTYKRSTFKTYQSLKDFVIELNPLALFVSGWMDWYYLRLAYYFNHRNIKTITFIDNHWNGSIKQKISTLLLGSILTGRVYNKAWVSGNRQYEFARRVGFKSENIECGFYCADQHLFEKIFESRNNSGGFLKKSIVFVGRFHEVKNLKMLIKSFENSIIKNDWRLTLIGNGPLEIELKELAQNNSNIIFKDFINPENLSSELLDHDVFCLPSISEPWGVVVHEFAFAGFPLLLSHNAGASDQFLINDYNGFTFDPDIQINLTEVFNKLSSVKYEDIIEMGKRSHHLANSITLELWVYKFLNLIKQ